MRAEGAGEDVESVSVRIYSASDPQPGGNAGPCAQRSCPCGELRALPVCGSDAGLCTELSEGERRERVLILF